MARKKWKAKDEDGSRDLAALQIEYGALINSGSILLCSRGPYQVAKIIYQHALANFSLE